MSKETWVRARIDITAKTGVVLGVYGSFRASFEGQNALPGGAPMAIRIDAGEARVGDVVRYWWDGAEFVGRKAA